MRRYVTKTQFSAHLVRGPMTRVFLLMPPGPTLPESKRSPAATVSTLIKGFSLHGGKVLDATFEEDG